MRAVHQQVVGHGKRLYQRLLALYEHDVAAGFGLLRRHCLAIDGQIAAVKALLPRQYAQKQALARLIGAGDAHAALPADRKAHIPEDGAVLVGLGDVKGTQSFLVHGLPSGAWGGFPCCPGVLRGRRIPISVPSPSTLLIASP